MSAAGVSPSCPVQEVKDTVYISFLMFYSTGARCSKLKMLLVNDSLKFQMAILQIHCYFLLEKCMNPLQGFSHFSTKNNSVFAFEVDIWLTNRGLLITTVTALS